MKFSQFSKWMNAIADAYNRGEADWAYPDGTSEAVRVWNKAFKENGFDIACETVVQWAQDRGITLKRRK